MKSNRRLCVSIVGLLFLTTLFAGCSRAEDKPAAVKEAQPAQPAAQAEVKAEAQPAAPAETPKAGEDLVYLKVESAVASSFDETPDWAPKPDAMAVVDRSMETRWGSDYKDNQWIYVDFGKPKTISRLVVKWEQAYAPSYQISVSEDAKTWTVVKKLENQTGGTAVVEFEPVTCRYVKLEGLVRINPEWGISVWEFEPYGPKEKNPDESATGEVTAAQKERADLEARVAPLRPQPGQVVASPGEMTLTEFQKGVNYTSWNADELSKDFSDYSLLHLKDVGFNVIGIMVVQYMDDATKKTIYVNPNKTITDETLGYAINMTHALGMQVMLKPHVDLADEDMRSNILASEEWFASYKKFILHYAEIAAKYNVELLCIGTELSNATTERWKAQWMDIIAEIRKIYKGKLTYASNFDDYDTISFWPEMDFIGIDAYFPLTDHANPTKEELVAAWTTHADTLEKWLKDAGLAKGVIFTEIGYDTIEGSNKQPYRVLPTLTKYKESQDEQANCLDALLTVLSQRPWFRGFYWWNYFPRSDIGALGYTLRGKKGEKLATEWFGKLK